MQAKLDWNDTIPLQLQQDWLQCRSSLYNLERFRIERCIKPDEFGRTLSSQLHCFADASQAGYVAVVYLRQVDDQGHILCAFLLGKARVSPLKSVTIPRMELTAATIAVRLFLTVKTELNSDVDSVTFWTDSTTVLRYIRNKTSRYHTYVANRVGYVFENSDEKQWKYVKSSLNPADDAARGITVAKYLNESRYRAFH